MEEEEEEEVGVLVFGSVLFPTRGKAKMKSQIDKGARISIQLQNFTFTTLALSSATLLTSL